MAHEALFAIRDEGGTRYCEDRWGGLGIDRWLLAGPAAWIEHVERYPDHATSAHTGGWLCGAVLVDVVERNLLYWADQFAGRSWLSRRYYRLLMEPRWQGWTTRWAMAGVLDFEGALGMPLHDDDDVTAMKPATLERIWERVEEPWESYCRDADPEELAADIARYGEDAVRSWSAEADFTCWISVRDGAGQLADFSYPDVFAHALSDGPAMVEHLRRRRPLQGIDHPIGEDHLTQTIFIDERARRIDWWWLDPPWIRPWDPATLWPGWALHQHDGGPSRHIELTGRSAEALRLPTDRVFDHVYPTLRRLLGDDADERMIRSLIADDH